MFIRSEIKAAAKAQIKGNIWILLGITILIGFLTGASAIVGIGPFLVAPAFGISLCLIYIGMHNGVRPQVGNMFDGFNYFGKALWLFIITEFFVFLWSLLFVIPGIVKSYAYSMAPYILAENPNMTAREALNESKRITAGKKGDLFVLDLSFFWWLLLISATAGIAGIYVAPYMSMTRTNAYFKLKEAAAPQVNI